MGQFLILVGSDDGERASLLAKGRRLFGQLADLVPHDELVTAPFSVCKFSKLGKPATKIARDEPPSTWACGVGAWFCDEQGPEHALRTLIEAVRQEPPELRDALERVDGSYVLAVGGIDSKECLIVTDRVGTIHAYATRVGSTQIVCTSSLILAALQRAQWDSVGVREFLATGTIFEQRTLFRGISKLEPARVYRCDGGGLGRRTKYWSFDDIRYHDRSSIWCVERLADALKQSLVTVSRSYERPLLDLTGGYDSRAVVAAMTSVSSDFTTVVNGSDDNPDVKVANRIAEAHGLRHHHHRPIYHDTDQWWLDAKASLALCDGEYDILEYARVLENHRRGMPDHDVSVNGSGGEFCKGYWWELLLPRVGSSKHFNPRRLAAARFATDPWGETMVADRGEGDMVEHFTGVIERATQSLAGRPNTARFDKVYLELRMQRWQGRIATATNRLWPCVSPFMFRGPLEAAFSAPPRVRFGNQMSARLIESLHPKLAAFPLSSGYPAIPLRPTNVHRFAPLASEFVQKAWAKVKGRLRRYPRSPSPETNPPLARLLRNDEVRDLLDVPVMRTRALYRPDSLDRFMNAVRGAGAIEASHVGRILTLEYLARRLADTAVSA